MGVRVIGAGSRRGWIARLVPPVGASFFLLAGSQETGVGAEGCGIVAGKTIDPRWNVVLKSVHALFFLVVGDKP